MIENAPSCQRHWSSWNDDLRRAALTPQFRMRPIAYDPVTIAVGWAASGAVSRQRITLSGSTPVHRSVQIRNLHFQLTGKRSRPLASVASWD